MQQHPTPRVVYRIVKQDPPERADLLPPGLGGALGRGTALLDPRLAVGISVFATLRQARALARRYPGLGTAVAELEVPESAVIERTLRRRGHYTMWGDPDELLRAIRRVVSVA